MENKINPHKNHRKRVASQIKQSAKMHEHQVIEYMLFGIIPHRDVNDLAHDLNDAFGSAVDVMNKIDTRKIPGVGPGTIDYFKLCADVYKCLTESKGERFTVKTVEKLIDRCLNSSLGLAVLYDRELRGCVAVELIPNEIAEIANCALPNSKYACLMLNKEAVSDDPSYFNRLMPCIDALAWLNYLIPDSFVIDKEKRLWKPDSENVISFEELIASIVSGKLVEADLDRDESYYSSFDDVSYRDRNGEFRSVQGRTKG